jgi:hypothetical protein
MNNNTDDKKVVEPPRWATRLLSWYCKLALLEDLEGDLNEYFQRNAQAKGVTRASMIYILDVLKFFRPYTARKPEFLNHLIHYVMIGSYIRTSGRSIVRNKMSSDEMETAMKNTLSCNAFQQRRFQSCYSITNSIFLNVDLIFSTTPFSSGLSFRKTFRIFLRT